MEMENGNENVEAKVKDVKSTVMKKTEEAEGFVSDSLSKLRSKMSSSTKNKTYPPPNLPDTPSNVINEALKAKFGKTFNNPFKYAIATYICLVFTAINTVYKTIHRDQRPSHSKWMVSCGIVCVLQILASVLVYYVVLACSLALHHVLYYGCILLAISGIGLAVSGAVFFDKQRKEQPPGFEAPSVRPSSGYDSNKLE